ncbi:MAG: hypothetical protein J1D77_00135 [Muribaculaceae bacterium]|nr:hypothetical protein [Muribaculaceae bacterium]
MKRFLTIAMGALAFAGLPSIASSQPAPNPDGVEQGLYDFTNRSEFRTPVFNRNEIKISKGVKARSEENKRIMGARKIGTRADEENPSIDGKWVFVMGDFYREQESVGEYYDFFEAKLIDGVVHFDNITNYEEPLLADYDEETRQLTFSRRIVTKTVYTLYEFYIYQEPFVYNDDLDRPEYQSVKATFRYEDGGWIQFDEPLSVEWAVYDLSNEYFTTINVLDIEDAFKDDFPDRDESAIWVDKGMATLVDGWVLPALGIDQMLPENQYEVKLQQYIHDPNMYRLVDPYKVGPAAPYNEATREGCIMFDITDPNCVIINPAGYEAGFANSDLGISRFFTYNQAMFYFLRWSLPPVSTFEYFPGVPRTILTDEGVIELNEGINSYDVEVYDANYGTQDQYYGGLQWYKADGARANMTTRIILPEGYNAITGIVDDYKGPAKYYNLQGREVKNPKAGEIVIKVEGNKSKKIMVR